MMKEFHFKRRFNSYSANDKWREQKKLFAFLKENFSRAKVIVVISCFLLIIVHVKSTAKICTLFIIVYSVRQKIGITHLLTIR